MCSATFGQIKSNTAYQDKHLLTTAKHGGGGEMLFVHQRILESDVRPFEAIRPTAWLKLGHETGGVT